MSKAKPPSRLVEIDALRGVAAMAVVLFHYTTRFHELYETKTSPILSISDGHYGVNLFFIISGFVIFMTLERTTRPMDFVVSRFSRLFPAYWFAIALTFLITHLLGLPGKLVGFSSAIGNVIMIHSFFKIPHVDGVYWTLEVELLFYCGMFVLYRLQRLQQIHGFLLALLMLRLVYFFMDRYFGIELPWTLSRLLILDYIPWFSLGISIYLGTSRHVLKTWIQPAVTAACAILTLFIVESLFVALLAIFLGTAVFLAASGRAPLLRHKVLVWLGSISYPLYLLHENIGWSIQLRLLEFGVPIDVAIATTLLCSLAIAGATTRWVEMPAMRRIRNNYRKRQVFA